MDEKMNAASKTIPFKLTFLLKTFDTSLVFN